jgi:hypothetical protein
VDRSELLDNLKTYGQHLLVTHDAKPSDLATGMGMALLALAELLMAGSQAAMSPEPPADGGPGFKAKASRW